MKRFTKSKPQSHPSARYLKSPLCHPHKGAPLGLAGRELCRCHILAAVAIVKTWPPTFRYRSHARPAPPAVPTAAAPAAPAAAPAAPAAAPAAPAAAPAAPTAAPPAPPAHTAAAPAPPVAAPTPATAATAPTVQSH